jgi:hypothetical protein
LSSPWPAASTPSVRSAAHRGDQHVGRAALGLEHLRARFGADDALEIAHELGIGMRARGGADDVEGVVDVGDPVAQRLVHGVLERLRAADDRVHFGAEQLHAEDVGLLPLDVLGAHEDGAGQAEARGDRGRGDAVLAGAGLGDDPRLAHADGEQDLADAVVDLVCAGVVELFALEVDFRAFSGGCAGAEMLGQALGEIERAGPPDVVLQQVVELCAEFRIVPRRPVFPFEVEDQRHQRLGHVASAELAEMAVFVGQVAQGVGCARIGCHDPPRLAERAGEVQSFARLRQSRPICNGRFKSLIQYVSIKQQSFDLAIFLNTGFIAAQDRGS